MLWSFETQRFSRKGMLTKNNAAGKKITNFSFFFIRKLEKKSKLYKYVTFYVTTLCPSKKNSVENQPIFEAERPPPIIEHKNHARGWNVRSASHVTIENRPGPDFSLRFRRIFERSKLPGRSCKWSDKIPGLGKKTWEEASFTVRVCVSTLILSSFHEGCSVRGKKWCSVGRTFATGNNWVLRNMER